MSLMIVNAYVSDILLGVFMYYLTQSSQQPFEELLLPLLTNGETKSMKLSKVTGDRRQDYDSNRSVLV